jgi:general stress protein 26
MLRGTATTSRDKAKIKELWSPVVKTWFTEGVDDPRMTVIKVTPSEGYYWDTKHGKAVAGMKMLIGAALGKTLDDSIEGNLAVG